MPLSAARGRYKVLEQSLPRLLRAGVCVKGCAALLHCSLSLLYDHTGPGALMHDLGLLRQNTHGSRTGLPSWAKLRDAKCCQHKCLACMPDAVLVEQFTAWKSAKCDKEKFMARQQPPAFTSPSPSLPPVRIPKFASSLVRIPKFGVPR